MSTKYGANVRQRKVARTLRKWRTDRGFNQGTIARKLRWSDAKLSRFERCEVIVGPAEIIALATIMGVSDDERDRTVRLAMSAITNQDQWGTYGPGSLRGTFREFVEDEADAFEIRPVETLLITGLLQTTAYMEALMGSRRVDVPDEVVAERIDLRQKRQARLDDPSRPLRLHTIMHESALRLPIGGAEVMEKQLDHLLKRGAQDSITIQIAPIAAGVLRGLGHGYHLIHFDEDGPGAVFMDGIIDVRYIEDEDGVAAHSHAFECLSNQALDPEESARLIAKIMRGWRTERNDQREKPVVR